MANQIRDLMTPGPISLRESETVADAARMMKECAVGDVLVCDDDGALYGIVTDRDLVVRCLAEGLGGRTKLRDICTQSVDSLEADASIDEAVSMMRRRAVRRLPILERGALIGIVSLGDLAREREPHSALGAISAAPASDA
jgi:CBS domain-containing protein